MFILSRICWLSATLFTYLSILPSAQADTDVTKFLNDALRQKPKVTRTRTAERIEEVCSWSGEPEPPRCRYESFPYKEKFADFARVTNNRTTIKDSVTFDIQRLRVLPETILVSRLDYYNCGPGIFNTSQSLSISGTKGWSISKTQGISSSLTIGLQGSFSVGAASTSLSVSQTITTSSSTTETESRSDTDTRSTNVSVSVGKGEAGYIEMLVYQTSAQIPFQATIIADGDLQRNISGFTKASDILSESERTLQFSGVVEILGMSNASTGNNPPNKPFDCTGVGPIAKVTPSEYSIPAEDIGAAYRQMFKIGNTQILGGGSTEPRLQVFLYPSLEPLSDDSIGAPDGVRYWIVSSSTVTEPTVACGFNDLSIPKNGNFRLEARQYENWSKGKLVASWSDTVKIFIGCAGGP